MGESNAKKWPYFTPGAKSIVSLSFSRFRSSGAVLDFAEQDGNTLVIVTADHETGGLALSGAAPQNAGNQMNSQYQEVTGKFTTDGHTATLIPVFAYGPGAEAFVGIYDNTDIFHKIKELIK